MNADIFTSCGGDFLLWEDGRDCGGGVERRMVIEITMKNNMLNKAEVIFKKRSVEINE